MGRQSHGWLSWHRLGLAKPVDLETWRVWFARALILMGAVLFPLGSVISLPSHIAEGHAALSLLNLLAWVLLLVRCFSRPDAYRANAFVIMALLYVLTTFYFITLGPNHARSAWLVACAVMAALMFGVRGAVVATVLNIVMLLVLYEVLGPGNREWTAEYQASYYKWLVFVVNSSLLTIISSLPVGYMLGRLDRSLKDERTVRRQLSEEGVRLKRSNEALAREIELRRDTEKSLREKEVYLRVLFEKAPDGYQLFDPEGRIVDINHATERMLGFRKEELVGKRFYDIDVIPAGNARDAISRFKVYMAGKVLDPFEEVLQRKDGGSVPVEINAFPVMVRDKIHLLSISRDVTMRKRAEEERKQMEHRLMQAQKLEALGTLAGGIAHDFNNILAAMIGYAELALTEAGKEAQLEHQLTGILKAGTRARDLVQQILTFSRRGEEQELRPVNVKNVARDVLKLMRATLPATIDIWQHLESDASVLAEPVQIHQLMMNLCTNSGQAMMDLGGVLEVRVSDVVPDAALLEKYPELKFGPHVEIVVTDTGAGIGPAAIERIFDPYFTTKAPGEGSGLGLAIVHGIVSKSGGALGVQSEPGHGTTFHIYLPVIESDAAADSEPASLFPTGTERILLVDDEPDIVEVGMLLLEKLGYRVDACVSSPEALDLFAKEPGKYDLVMTDMTMPGITGRELAEKMTKIRADIPIVICSGFSHRIDKGDACKMGVRAFIMKPLKLQEIAYSVRKVLDEAPSGPPSSDPAN